MAILTKNVLMGRDLVAGTLSGELLVADQANGFSGKNLDSALAALVAKIIADDASGAAAASAALSAESTAREADVDAEESRALAAEAAIQADVDQNESDAEAAMVSEAASRVSGDAAERSFALLARNANESARDASIAAAKVTADAAIVTAKGLADAAIATELTARLAAEAAIDARVDAILSGSSADLDQFVEVVNAYTAADGNLQTSVTNLSNAAATDRAAVRSEFAAADTSAAAFNLAARNAIIVQHGIDDGAAATARNGMIAAAAAESTARVAAEGVIQADVDANELEEKGRMDEAGGFTVDSTASSWEMGWGAGKPVMSFSISDGVVTMSVEVG